MDILNKKIKRKRAFVQDINIREQFRFYTKEWKVNLLKHSNYKCILSGDKDFDIHHIITFSTLLYDFFKNNNIQDYNSLTVEDYYKFKIYHEDKVKAVLLSKKLHRLYHALYLYSDGEVNFKKFVKLYYRGLITGNTKNSYEYYANIIYRYLLNNKTEEIKREKLYKLFNIKADAVRLIFKENMLSKCILTRTKIIIKW